MPISCVRGKRADNKLYQLSHIRSLKYRNQGISNLVVQKIQVEFDPTMDHKTETSGAQDHWWKM